jgi:RNA polymerase sigma-70 factor (ECF subfamily)
MNHNYAAYQNRLSDSDPASPEGALILMAKSGDQIACAELCRRHSKRVFQTVLRLTKNREDAEDALQDSVMKALIHLGGFDGRSSFSTWLTRIAINSVLMMFRKRRNRSERFIDCWAEPGSSGYIQIPDRSLSAEDHVHFNERDLLISNAIQRLPATLRIPLEAHLAEDIPMKELACKLGLSVPATKSRLLRARAQIRRYVARKHECNQEPKQLSALNGNGNT